jgi:nucleoside 2-deoxyribosyltransferase
MRPSKNIYLAGPISDCSHGEATEWRKLVEAQFLPGIIGVSPMRLKDWCKRLDRIQDVEQYREATSDEEFLISGESHAICARDYNDVSTADMIFAYLPQVYNDRRPSWGTAIELGWASALRKPVVLVTDDKRLASHPLVRESVGWIVPTLAMGVDVVNSVFGVYVGATGND